MKSIQSFPHFFYEDINSLINNLKNYKKILIIHSNSFNNGNTQKKIKNLIKSKIEYINISKNKFDINSHFYKKKLKKNLDLVLSVGGGSAIDTGKIIYNKISKKKKNNYSNKIHFGVIVTLPGSGAEASKTCVINSSKGKEFFISRDFIPKFIFYDRDKISSNNKTQQIFLIIDSLVHGIESQETILKSYFSNTISHLILDKSKKIFKKIINNKNKKLQNKIVNDICMLSFFGGIAQSECGSSFCHAIGHTLEIHFNIPHSEAIFLSTLIRLNYEKKLKLKSKFYEFRNILNMNYKMLPQIKKNKFKKILAKIDIEVLIEKTKKDPCFKLTEKLINIEILKKTILSMKKRTKWIT